MTRRQSTALAALLLLCGGCEPIARLTVILPDDIDAADVTLQVDGYALGADSDIDCDKLAFGETTREQLVPTRFLETTISEASDGEIGKIPKSGRKMILVDALDAGGVRVASGCEDLGAIKAAGARIVVKMQDTADVAVDAADVVIVGDPRTNTSVFVSAKDGSPVPSVNVTLTAGGKNVDGVVRFTRINADGNTAVIGDVEIPAAGASFSPPPVDGAGPFAVVAQARFARSDTAPPPLPGLSVFVDDVDVGGAEAGAQFVAVSRPASFVMAAPNGDNTAHVVTVADIRQGSPVAPGTALVASTTAGTVPHVAAGGDRAPQFLGTYVEGGDVFALMQVFGGVCGGALAQCVVRAPNVANIGGGTLLRPGSAAAGPCTDDDGVPFAFIDKAGTALELPSGDALVDVASDASLALVQLESSTCADDVDGVAHRLVRTTIDLGDRLGRAPFLLDIHDGVTGTSNVAFAALEVPGLLDSPALARGIDGSLLVPLKVIGGFVVASLTLVPPDPPSTAFTVEENAELAHVPNKPIAIAAGHFTAADRDEVATLSMPGAAGDATRDRTLLFVVGATGVTGAVPLDCRGPEACNLIAADVDGDGKDDLLVARIDAAGQAHLETYRF